MVARPRTLALCALVSALLLPPAAGATEPQGPVASVTDATRDVTTAVQGTTGSVAEPVTTAVEETTAKVTQPVVEAVEDTVAGATQQVQPVVNDAGKTVDAVTSGAAPQARETVAPASPSSEAELPAAPGAAPVRGHTEGRSLRQGTAVGLESGRAELRSVEAPRRGDARPGASADAPAAAARDPLGAPFAAASRAPGQVEAENGSGSGAPGPEVPAAAAGSASALSTGLGLGGLALLAGALCLAAPALLRTLSALPAIPRPVLFVSPLERPG